MILNNWKMYVNVPKNNLNYWGYKLVTKKMMQKTMPILDTLPKMTDSQLAQLVNVDNPIDTKRHQKIKGFNYPSKIDLEKIGDFTRVHWTFGNYGINISFKQISFKHI